MKAFEWITDPCIRTFLINSGVQHGTGRAFGFLKAVMEPLEPKDAVTANPYILLKHLVQERAEFYDNIIRKHPAQRKFKRGWAGRMARDLSEPSPDKLTEDFRLGIRNVILTLYSKHHPNPFVAIIEALRKL